MTARPHDRKDKTRRRPAPELRSPQIVTSGGTASVHLTLAICDYEHVREIAQGIVRADGITLTPLIFPSIEEITFRFTRIARMGRLRAVVREVHLAHLAGRGADGGDPGVSVARASPFGDLCAQRPRHPDRRGPGRARRRHSGMGADRRHLCARLPGRGLWRRSHQDPLAAGRRQRARPRRRRSSSSCRPASATRRGRRPASPPCSRAARSTR